ncbi:MAG: S53 family peptidase [Nocardioides sp.]|uniref:S53 family peptidase n=1 Tax=Nocardioides sp. TaxID=35761 RepID=UPI0039E328AD
MHLPHRAKVGAAVVAAATALALSAAAVPAHAASAKPRHTLAGSKPTWLGQATEVGKVADSTQLHFSVLLGLRNAGSAAALVQRLSDPSSASYGTWLSTAQFRQRFAPTSAQLSSVTDWLANQGLTVDDTLPGRMLVQVHGSTSAVEKAFDTTMRNYRFDGHRVHANATALSLPASAPSIEGVVGLDQAATLKTPGTSSQTSSSTSASTASSTTSSTDTDLPGPPDGARYGVQPCSSYFGQKTATTLPKASGKHQPYAVCGYGSKQLQGAYGISSMLKKGYTGKGITVAITDAFAAPTILADANRYAVDNGQAAFKRGQFSQITPSDYDLIDECGGNGWYGEETLDVEAVHTMAPGAKIVYVAGSDCSTGLDTAWAETIDEHRADVITNSWSDGLDDIEDLGQAYVDYYTEFSTEAALTGITVSFSSGDDGDHTAGNTDPSAKTAEFPSDVPYVTAVGGTSLEVGKTKQWQGEYGWQNDYSTLDGNSWSTPSYSSGGGGGVSQLFDQPYYQRGVVPDSMSTVDGTKMRVVPDVAMDADPNTGMTVGETQVFPDGTYYDTYRIGGTSLASPLFAGVAAVAGQAAGRPIGFANPLLYSLNGSKALHDIVAPKKPVYQVRTDYTNYLDDSDGYTYKLQTIDTQTSTLHSVRGYDDETGVGSPNGTAFFTSVSRQVGGRHHR